MDNRSQVAAHGGHHYSEILSTPVIDTQAKVMYLVTETLEDGDIIEAVVDGRAITGPDPDPDPGEIPNQDPASVRFRIEPAPNHCSWEFPVVRIHLAMF